MPYTPLLSLSICSCIEVSRSRILFMTVKSDFPAVFSNNYYILKCSYLKTNPKFRSFCVAANN